LGAGSRGVVVPAWLSVKDLLDFLLSSSKAKLQKYVVGAPLGGWPACTPAPRERGAKGNI
jgi:hypothetical protein